MGRTVAILALALVACAESHPTTDGGPVVPADAPVLPDTPPRCPFVPTSSPYGTSVGRSFRPLELDRCDGTAFSFYDDPEFCAEDHRLTVVNLAAVWCVPSQRETSFFETELVEHYRGRGVRLVQVMLDGATAGGGITPSECLAWIDRYALSSTELLDSGGEETAIYTPRSTFPVWMIVDRDGVIRYVHTGVLDAATIRGEIDARL